MEPNWSIVKRSSCTQLIVENNSTNLIAVSIEVPNVEGNIVLAMAMRLSPAGLLEWLGNYLYSGAYVEAVLVGTRK